MAARDPRDKIIAELREENAQLRAQLKAALEEIAKLKEELGKSSSNSSKPPSSDSPQARDSRKKKPPTGRKPGGQPGHQRSTRPLVPLDQVNRVFVHKPSHCAKCEAPLSGEDPTPLRHQVFELPKVKPSVDEHQLHALPCACGHVTRAALPAGVPTGAFGPGVCAAVATLLAVYRMSRRMVTEFMADFFDLAMCTGSVVKCQQVVSAAVAKPVKKAHEHVKAAPVKYCDESGWREGRQRAFLWTVVTAAVTVFVIHARRSAEAAKAVVGNVTGLLVTDRHGAYNAWPDRWRQFCWSHLTRAFQAIAERGGASKAIGEALLAEKTKMFEWWHRVRDGTLQRTTFRRKMKTLRSDVYLLLMKGARTCAGTKTGRTCNKLLDHFESLWTFVKHEGVEPTNNGGERALRHGVILRKVCYGSHSSHGSRFIERMLTCHATLRQQGRNVLDFLTEASEAQLMGTRPPSLLPSRSARSR